MQAARINSRARQKRADTRKNAAYVEAVAIVMSALAVSALFLWLAWLERGYFAVGGEWMLVIGAIAVAAGKIIRGGQRNGKA